MHPCRGADSMKVYPEQHIINKYLLTKGVLGCSELTSQ